MPHTSANLHLMIDKAEDVRIGAVQAVAPESCIVTFNAKPMTTLVISGPADELKRVLAEALFCIQQWEDEKDKQKQDEASYRR